jgi:hypothetical protein
VSVAFDPSAIVPLVETAYTYSLNINGSAFPDLPVFVELEGRGYLKVDTETYGGGPAVRLSRDDSQLTEAQKRSIFEALVAEEGNIMLIADVPPDSNGNINITFVNAVNREDEIFLNPIVTSEGTLGFVLMAPALFECPESDLSELIRCRTEQGIVVQLPLDYINCPENIVCDTEFDFSITS